MKKSRLIVALASLAVASGFLTPAAHAQVCAVCTVVIGGALGLSQYLGVNDLLSGIWLGALVLALGSFIGHSVFKKTHVAWHRWTILGSIVTFSYLSLYLLNFFADSPHDFGMPNLLLGMLIGTIALLLGEATDKLLRRLKNDSGKPFFPFQKVVCPVVCLLIATLLTQWCCLSH
ncbi:hypothetical protein IJJ12_02045 [bacterium]|nr:hypothetical protein [bacterium]